MLYCLLFKTGQIFLKSQLFIKLIGFFVKHIPVGQLIWRNINGGIRIYSNQLKTQVAQLLIFREDLLDFLGRNLFKICVNIFYGPEFFYKLCGSLFPYSWKPGNIIGRISHKSLNVYKLSGGDAVHLLHIRGSIMLNRCGAKFRFGNNNSCIFRGKLQKIPVSRNYKSLVPGFICTLCKGTYYIISLVAFLLNALYIHGLKNFLHHRYLGHKFRCRRFAVTLVLLIHFMPEGRSMHIKGHRHIIR